MAVASPAPANAFCVGTEPSAAAVSAAPPSMALPTVAQSPSVMPPSAGAAIEVAAPSRSPPTSKSPVVDASDDELPSIPCDVRSSTVPCAWTRPCESKMTWSARPVANCSWWETRITLAPSAPCASRTIASRTRCCATCWSTALSGSSSRSSAGFP
eukprot:1553921-Prymnesium_polylepis.2